MKKVLLIFLSVFVIIVAMVYASKIIAKDGNMIVEGKLGVGNNNPEAALDVIGGSQSEVPWAQQPSFHPSVALLVSNDDQTRPDSWRGSINSYIYKTDGGNGNYGVLGTVTDTERDSDGDEDFNDWIVAGTLGRHEVYEEGTENDDIYIGTGGWINVWDDDSPCTRGIQCLAGYFRGDVKIENGNLRLSSNDIVFVADDPGDIVFRNSAGQQKARIWSGTIGSERRLFLSSEDDTPDITIEDDGKVTVRGDLDASGNSLSSCMWVEIAENNVDYSCPKEMIVAGIRKAGGKIAGMKCCEI